MPHTPVPEAWSMPTSDYRPRVAVPLPTAVLTSRMTLTVQCNGTVTFAVLHKTSVVGAELHECSQLSHCARYRPVPHSRCFLRISRYCLFVCLFIWNTKYSNKVRPAGATRIIINATLDIRRFKRYSEMTIYKRPLKNENTPRLV